MAFSMKISNPRALLADPFPFIAFWLIAGVLAIVIPVIRWSKEKRRYYQYIGYQIEYEQAQRNYEENQNGNGQNNNNYYYNSCKWWQWGCRKRQYQYQQYQEGGEDQVQVPNWYLFIGGQTEQDRRQQEENGQQAGSSGALKFVYVWSLILFVLVLAYGVFVLYKRRPTLGLMILMLLFASFSLMNLLLMGQGVIETDGRAMEDSIYGWYGQLGVLMVYTDFWYMMFCIVFVFALAVRMFLFRRSNKNANQGGEENAYQQYEAPEVRMTSA